MSLGNVIRNYLGPKAFNKVADYYRRIFVDLSVVAKSISPYIPTDAKVLDIGGGDGALLNHLLELRSDIRVTMIDLNPKIGLALFPSIKGQVEILGGMSIEAYTKSNRQIPDCVLISDVIHHVPPEQRSQLFRDLLALLGEQPKAIIIKDVEPGHFRSYLGWLADRYISGDSNVSLISRENLQREITSVFARARCDETPLLKEDAPNYALVFSVR